VTATGGPRWGSPGQEGGPAGSHGSAGAQASHTTPRTDVLRVPARASLLLRQEFRIGVRRSLVVLRPANPVAACDDHDAFFVGRQRADPDGRRHARTRAVQSLMHDSRAGATRPQRMIMIGTTMSASIRAAPEIEAVQCMTEESASTYIPVRFTNRPSKRMTASYRR
jgi:hypothetical protein